MFGDCAALAGLMHLQQLECWSRGPHWTGALVFVMGIGDLILIDPQAWVEIRLQMSLMNISQYVENCRGGSG